MKFFLISILFLSLSFTTFATPRLDDGHLFGAIQDVEQSLIENEHSQAQLQNALKALQKAYDILEPSTGRANLTLSDGPVYNFGTRAVGGVTSHTFTVVNSGNASATAIVENGGLVAPFVFTGGTYPGIGGSCGASLDAGRSCTIDVTFAPFTTGALTDTVALSYFDGTDQQVATRKVSGTGASRAVLTISESDLFNFGSLVTGNSRSHTFSVNNVGGYSATSLNGSGLVAPFSYMGGVFPGVDGTCGSTLAPASTCTIVVEYGPTVPSANDSDTIELLYFDGAATQVFGRDVAGSALPN